MRRTVHAQTRRLPHKHTEPNCYEWLSAPNKCTDNKNAKRNQNISEQQCENTTGTWRMRWGNYKQTPRSNEMFSPGHCQKDPQKYANSSAARIQRHRHARKECCNLCCRHPLQHHLDCIEVFFLHLHGMATNHGKELLQFFCGGTVSGRVTHVEFANNSFHFAVPVPQCLLQPALPDVQMLHSSNTSLVTKFSCDISICGLQLWPATLACASSGRERCTLRTCKGLDDHMDHRLQAQSVSPAWDWSIGNLSSSSLIARTIRTCPVHSPACLLRG